MNWYKVYRELRTDQLCIVCPKIIAFVCAVSAGATELPDRSEQTGAGAGEVWGNPQEADEISLQLAFQVREEEMWHKYMWNRSHFDSWTTFSTISQTTDIIGTEVLGHTSYSLNVAVLSLVATGV